MRVLIADDEPVNRFLLEKFLAKWGYEIVIAADGAQAWEILSGGDAPRLAILDWMMPGLDGVEICRKVRERGGSDYTYVILLTTRFQRKDVIAGLEAGADDYVTKPFDPSELRARLHSGERIIRLHEDLDAARRAVEYQASHDALTNLWNRSAILALLQGEVSRARRTGSTTGIIMADVDHFKRINDALGHLAGDCVLEEIARCMEACTRSYDAAGRYGGEEFLMVVSGGDAQSTAALAERVRSAVAERTIPTPQGDCKVTISLGWTVYDGAEEVDVRSLIHLADQALYRAKWRGRDRVESALPAAV